MEDREAVAAILAGDPAGLADAYDRYAASLYGYCRTLLREPADAADAVQDTFVIAAARVSALRDARKLRPWLYAVARNECLRKLRSCLVAPAIEETEDLSETAQFSQLTQRRELRELVGAAISGLNPPDREVFELDLRHDLDGADLAAVFGVSRSHARTLVSGAHTQFENALGSLLVARAGRRACPALDELLTGWDGRLTILLRKRVSKHIDRCDECGERKRRAVPAAMRFGIPALPMIPPMLRDQVLRLCADQSPAAVEAREAIVRRAGLFSGTGGFPRPLQAAGRNLRDPGAGVVAAVSVAAAAAVIISMIALRGSTPSTLEAKAGSGGGGAGAVVASSTSGPGSPRTAPSAAPEPSDSTPARIHPSASTVTTMPSRPPATFPSFSQPPPTHSPSPKPTKSPKPIKTPTHSPSPSPSATSTSPSPTPTTNPPTTPPPTSAPATTTPPAT